MSSTYAKLPRLTEPRGQEVEATFSRLATLLRDSGQNATLQVTLLARDAPRQFALDLKGTESRQRRAAKVPDVEIITEEATWWEIAEGRLSPLDAFERGRLRILGDTDVATRLFRHLAPVGIVSICGG